MNEAAAELRAETVSVKFTEKNLRNFWRKVDKDGPLPDQTNPHYAGIERCWIWTGYRNKKGYGVMAIQKTATLVHRISWGLANGPTPEGTCILHKCDNPACVKIAHLFLGDNLANVADRESKGRGNQPSGIRHGRNTKPEKNPRGENNGRSRLSSVEVAAIRSRYESGGVSQDSLAAEYGVSQLLVSKIVRRILWKHVP